MIWVDLTLGKMLPSRSYVGFTTKVMNPTCYDSCKRISACHLIDEATSYFEDERKLCIESWAQFQNCRSQTTGLSSLLCSCTEKKLGSACGTQSNLRRGHDSLLSVALWGHRQTQFLQVECTISTNREFQKHCKFVRKINWFKSTTVNYDLSIRRVLWMWIFFEVHLFSVSLAKEFRKAPIGPV